MGNMITIVKPPILCVPNCVIKEALEPINDKIKKTQFLCLRTAIILTPQLVSSLHDDLYEE